MRVSRQSGFTMIELMMVLVIATILVAIATPNIRAVINSNRLTAAANELVGGIQLARAEAIRRNTRAILCASANANAGTGATCANSNVNGWIVFVDANKSNSFDGGDTLLRGTSINTPVQMAWSSAINNGVISFRSDGRARSSAGALVSGVMDVCIPTSLPDENIRHVGLGSGSRVSVSRANGGGACNAPSNNP
jgi:type IV fimbrial biogenesis protein FimT